MMQLIEYFGVGFFAEIALCIFFAIFVFAVVRVIRHPRREIDAMAGLPLAGESTRSDASRNESLSSTQKTDI